MSDPFILTTEKYTTWRSKIHKKVIKQDNNNYNHTLITILIKY